MTAPEMKLIKVSFNLPTGEFDRVKTLAVRRAIPVTQVLRQAIFVEQTVQDIADRGAKLLVEEPDGTTRELILGQTQYVPQLPKAA